MKLLILPSHKLMLYVGKQILTLLPDSILAQEYSTINHHSHTHTHSQSQSKDNNNSNSNQSIVALHHYKTVSIYKQSDLLSYLQNDNNNIKPIISQYFPKKVQVLDTYSTPHQKYHRQCIISDKFGDIYKININSQQNNNNNNKQDNKNDNNNNINNTIKQSQHTPIYTNSNLGIPKYIKHISLSHLQGNKKYKQYLILGDQQNRIKIYNSLNPHQLISVWFMINMYSIECHVLHAYQHNYHKQHKNVNTNINVNNNYPIIILLLKYYNKLTLQSNIQLHYFVASPHNLQAEQYPGIKIQSKLTNKNTNANINMKQCKYFTTLHIKTTHKQQYSGNAILLLYLFQNKIVYEYFLVQSSKGDHKTSVQSKYWGQIKIQQGNWDYLYGIDTQQNNTVVIAYGNDVEMPVDIQIQMKDNKQENSGHRNKTVNLKQNQHISLNKYEKIVKLQLKAL